MKQTNHSSPDPLEGLSDGEVAAIAIRVLRSDSDANEVGAVHDIIRPRPSARVLVEALRLSRSTVGTAKGDA